MSQEVWTLERALRKGVELEEESIALYTETAEKASYPGARKLLQELAEEERKHRDYFLKALEDPSQLERRSLSEEVTDLRITDTLVRVPLDPKAGYPQLLIYAAQREKDTHDFYAQLAKKFRGEPLGQVFHDFAKAELYHKYLLEREYDDVVLAEM